MVVLVDLTVKSSGDVLVLSFLDTLVCNCWSCGLLDIDRVLIVVVPKEACILDNHIVETLKQMWHRLTRNLQLRPLLNPFLIYVINCLFLV